MTGLGFKFLKRKQHGHEPLLNDSERDAMTNHEDTTTHAQKRFKKQGLGHKARQFIDMYLTTIRSREPESSSSPQEERAARSGAFIRLLQPRPPIPETPPRRRRRDESRAQRGPAPLETTQLVTIQHAVRPPIGTNPPQFDSVMRVASPRYETFARSTHSTIIFANIPASDPTPELPPPTYSRFDGLP